MLLLSVYLASATDGGWGRAFKLPTGQTPTVVFAKTELSRVASADSDGATYVLQCGTLNAVRTCAISSDGKELARSTSITLVDGGFRLEFPGTTKFYAKLEVK